jgi:CBS domain-containing protein
MTNLVVTGRDDMSLKEAARLMSEGAISGLPVVDDQGVVIGIVSEGDFVQRAGGKRRESLLDLLFDHDKAKLDAKTVGEAMTNKVVTIDQDATHATAARLMEKKGVKRLPVVDADGRLVGIVSRSDILDVFVRPDDAIEQEIRLHVISEVIGADPEDVEVEVDEGVVTLSGTLPARTDVLLLEHLSAGVDGVLGVDSTVHSMVDDTAGAYGPEVLGPTQFGMPRRNW